jgi:hypothetical protein
VAPKSPDVMRPIAATVVASMHSIPASDSGMVCKWIAWHERRHFVTYWNIGDTPAPSVSPDRDWLIYAT